ncbi:MAG TPA: ABC transporter ATP-binding protein [Candidatus Methylomirabilis sp.]|jgi:branched-chain amino acid transport system ATP-binding protein
MKYLLEIESLMKSFGGFLATDGVSLAVEQGSLCSLIGPNGAGKTTLFNQVTGYLVPDSGRITFKGKDITGLHPYQISRKGITRAFQVINIFPRLTVMESAQLAILAKRGYTLKFFAGARKMVREEAMAVLETVGLADKAGYLAKELSHGEQRTLEMALALAGEPELLLLDEPMAGMSPFERVKATELIQKIHEERGLTVLFCEHDMDVVFGISEKVTVLHQGRVIAEGKPEDIKKNEEVNLVYLGHSSGI